MHWSFALQVLKWKKFIETVLIKWASCILSIFMHLIWSTTHSDINIVLYCFVFYHIILYHNIILWFIMLYYIRIYMCIYIYITNIYIHICMTNAQLKHYMPHIYIYIIHKRFVLLLLWRQMEIWAKRTWKTLFRPQEKKSTPVNLQQQMDGVGRSTVCIYISIHVYVYKMGATIPYIYKCIYVYRYIYIYGYVVSELKMNVTKHLQIFVWCSVGPCKVKRCTKIAELLNQRLREQQDPAFLYRRVCHVLTKKALRWVFFVHQRVQKSQHFRILDFLGALELFGKLWPFDRQTQSWPPPCPNEIFPCSK